MSEGLPSLTDTEEVVLLALFLVYGSGNFSGKDFAETCRKHNSVYPDNDTCLRRKGYVECLTRYGGNFSLDVYRITKHGLAHLQKRGDM